MNKVGEFIDDCVDIIKKHKKLEPEGLLAVDSGEIHLTTEKFTEMFFQFDIKGRLSEKYPYELLAKYKGETFFTILSEEEYKKHIKKERLND